MKVIIAGSRTITALSLIERAIAESGFDISEVVCGMARGADMLGYKWAQRHQKPVREFPADWQKNGRGAGPIRNQEMADYANALIAVWDGRSAGTYDMISRAKQRGLRVHVLNLHF